MDQIEKFIEYLDDELFYPFHFQLAPERSMIHLSFIFFSSLLHLF